MVRTLRFLGLSLLALFTFGLTGCVSTDKYNALKLSHDSSMERLARADSQTQAAIAEAEVLRQQNAQLLANQGPRDGMFQNLTAQIGALQRERDDLDRKYQEALQNRGQVVVTLDPVLNEALTQFASEHPNLVDFDSARGTVKFKSDVTFNVGSADLTGQAGQAINSFAQILNSPSASRYELMVAGHTDNQPVRNPET